MRDEREEAAFRLLFEAVKAVGIILQRTKKRNEFIIKPALKGCGSHLSISDEAGGLHRHIKNERAPPKSTQKYTHVREIPEMELIKCFLDSLDDSDAESSPAHCSEPDTRDQTLETAVDTFLHRATRPTKNHQVWTFDAHIGGIFSEFARTDNGTDRITHLSKMIAESKRIPKTGRLVKTNEMRMWSQGKTLAVNRSRSRMIMILDEATVLDLSVIQLRRLVSNVSGLMGLEDLRNAIRPTPAKTISDETWHREEST